MVKAHDRAVNQQLSGDVKISTDVASNLQLRCVKWYFVLIMVCTGRALDRIANAIRGWSAKACLFQACSPKNNARLVVLMVVDLVFSLGTNDVVAEAGDAMDVSAILKRSPKGASKRSGRSKD